MARWYHTLHYLNLSCREVAQLHSESLDRPLSRSERWAVGLHLVYCSACRRFRRQLRFLRAAMQRLNRPPHTPPPLPEAVRSRIVEAMRESE